MLNFDFLEEDLGIVFPPHFVYGFSRKIFLINILLTEYELLTILLTKYSIKIVRLLLLFEMLGDMCIAIVC